MGIMRGRTSLGRGALIGFECVLVLALALTSSAAAQGQKLNGPLSRMSGGSVRGSAISADGTWVVYAADQESFQVVELYSVPIEGDREPIRISGPISFYDSD